MRATTCLTLLAAGAIAAFAVHLPTFPVNMQVAGLILMATGIVGFFVPARPSEWVAPEWMRRRILVHGDLPERDLTDTWSAALSHPIGTPFPLLDLWNPLEGRDHLVAVFLALLFLAREKSIELRQDVLGESPVMVVRTAEERQPISES